LLDDLEDLVYTQEILFGSTSIYAQYKVMKIAKESGFKVVLDGQRGDELFTGYTVYYPVFFYEMLKNLDFRSFIREFLNLNNSPVSKSFVLKSLSLNEQLYQLITGKNLKTLLKYEDRNSMRFSIESRTPFADDINLIEYMFKIPSAYKIHNGWSKYILRQSMKDILPKQILNRKE